jgi:SSS family solute:Na+ symporter
MQFFLIVFGFAPLVFLGLRDIGGWSGLKEKLVVVATEGKELLGHSQNYDSNAWTSAWGVLGSPSSNPMGVEWLGMAMGLGFVLSFGYWCTNFLVIQRAMVAKDENSARMVPLIAAVPKMLFPILVILPGMIAVALTAGGSGFSIPKLSDGALDYNMVIPSMLAYYFPTGLLGVGLTALMASFMSGMAGNVTAFNTVWTYDIYQSYLAKGKSDQHYLWMGRVATVVGTLVSVAAAYLAASFDNIMDFLQLLFAFVNAPLFATFLLGMFWRRTTGHGAFIGLISGTIAAAIHHGLTLPFGAGSGIKGGWLIANPLHTYSSEMAQSFWTAIWAWTTCFVVTILVSALTTRTKTDDELRGLVYSLTERRSDSHLAWYRRPATVGVVILVFGLVLNLLFI